MIRTVVLVALVFAGCSQDARTVTVPDVTGLRSSQAQCAIADAGLRWRDRSEQSAHGEAKFCSPDSAFAPDPPVLRQRPAAGRHVARATTVVLVTACSRRRSCD